MANYQNLKAAISEAIKTNGNQEITGQVLQDVLNSIVSVIGANYTFAGVATPATNPGTPDQNVMYLAMEGGTYTNFNGTVLPAGISLLMWNGTWMSETVMYGDGGVFDISVYKSSGGTLAKYADLADALDGGNNIPANARKGGMSVKFVCSSDNKIVQYRYMGTDVTGNPNPFLNTANWQGVDSKPTPNSPNLIESKGVFLSENKRKESVIYTSETDNFFDSNGLIIGCAVDGDAIISSNDMLASSPIYVGDIIGKDIYVSNPDNIANLKVVFLSSSIYKEANRIRTYNATTGRSLSVPFGAKYVAFFNITKSSVLTNLKLSRSSSAAAQEFSGKVLGVAGAEKIFNKEAATEDDVFVRNYIEGWYLNQNGGIIADQNTLICSDYIDVSIRQSDEITWFNGGLSSTYKLCYYNSSKEIINYLSGDDAEYRTNAIPSGTAYIRATFKKSYKSDARIVIGNKTYWRCNDSIIFMQKNRSMIDSANKDGMILSYLPNSYHDTDGVLKNANGYSATKTFIDISQRKSNICIWQNNALETGHYLIAFDSSKTRLNSWQGDGNQERVIVLPPSTKYLLASFKDGGENKIIVDNVVVFSKENGNDLEKSVLKSSSIDNFQNYLAGYQLNNQGGLVANSDRIVSYGIDVSKRESNTLTWMCGLVEDANFYLIGLNENNEKVDYWGVTLNAYSRTITLGANIKRILATFRNDKKGERAIILDGQVIWHPVDSGNQYKYLNDQINREYESRLVVPKYYQEYLAGKITGLVSKDVAYGMNGDSFIFITDMHVEFNFMHSPALIKQIMDKTNITKMFNGGDVIHGQSTKDGAIQKIRQWLDAYNFTEQYVTIGNHDINQSVSQPAAAALSDANLYGLFDKKIENLAVLNKKTYFYLDNEAQKIRYFFMDMHWPYSPDRRGEDLHFSEQLSWLEAKSLEVGSEWHIVVLGHVVYSSQTFDGTTVVSADLSQLATALVAKLDEMYDDPSMPTIIGVFSGHTHYDYASYSAKGYPIIATTCDTSATMEGDSEHPSGVDILWPSVRTENTVNEQAFDVVHIDLTGRKIYMTRIGYGIDREFTF